MPENTNNNEHMVIMGDDILKEQGIQALIEMGLTEDEAEMQFEDMFGY